MNLMDGQNVVLSNPALTGIAGAATTHSYTAFDFSNKGNVYTEAVASGAATPTVGGVSGDAIALTANKAVAVVWAINAAGSVAAFEGEVVDLEAATGNYINDVPQFAHPPADYTPFAYTIHKAGSTLSGTFTFGVSNWNTTGMTHVVGNLVGGLPGRPDAA